MKIPYYIVGEKTWLKPDFDNLELEKSRFYFEKQSLIKREPNPKKLDVYAILAGIPFDRKSVSLISHAQDQISTILDRTLCYFVKPENLGLEFLVLKWPSQILNSQILVETKEHLLNQIYDSFVVNIKGVQFNSDGCILLKGYPDNISLKLFRESMKLKFPDIPKRQSQWCHIPLGRILEPVGTEIFEKLKEIYFLEEEFCSFKITIKRFHLVHEKRWYMEDKEILKTFNLVNEQNNK